MALDANEAAALEATLTTRTLNGAPDTPVTNIRMVVRNASQVSFAFVSGIVTFMMAQGYVAGRGSSKPTPWLSMNRLRQTRREFAFAVTR